MAVDPLAQFTQQVDASGAIATKTAKAVDDLAAKVNKLERSLDPAAVAAKRLADQQKLIDAAVAQGLRTQEEAERLRALSLSRLDQQVLRQKQAASSLGGFGDALGKVNGLLATFGIGLGVTAITGFISRSLDAVGSLGELAEQLGVSTKALQTYQLIAAQSGVSQEELRNALGRLTRSIGDAGDGTKAAVEAFRRIGVAFENADGSLRSTESVFLDLANAVRAIEDPGARATVVFDILGRQGQKLLPVLSQGSDEILRFGNEAERAGRIVRDDLIGAADAASDSIGALREGFAQLSGELAARASPFLATFVNLIRDVLSGGSLSQQLADQVLGPQGFADLDAALEKVTKLQQRLQETIDGRGAFKSEAARQGVIADLRRQIAEAQGDAEKLRATLNDTTGTATTPAGAVAKALPELRDASAEMAAITQTMDLLLKQFDGLVKETEAWSAALMETSDSILDGARLKIQQSRQAINDGLQEFERTIGRDIERQKDLMQEPFKNAARGIQDAFADTFYDIFDGGISGFKGFASSVLDIFKRLAAEIAALLVFRPVVSGILGGVGLGGMTNALGLGGSAFSLSSLIGGGSSGYAGIAASGALSTLGAAGLGALGGNLLNGLIGGNRTGGSIGGGIGAGAGMFFGGPLGALAGGALGSLLGGLFGNSQPSNLAFGRELSLADGVLGGAAFNPAKFSQQNADSVNNALTGLSGQARALQELTGGRLSGKVGLVAGSRDGVQVTVNGVTQTVQTVDQASAIIGDALLKGLTGLKPEIQALVDENIGTPFDTAVQKITEGVQKLNAEAEKLAALTNFRTSLGDQVAALVDPSSAGFTQAFRGLQGNLGQISALGGGADDISMAFKLYALTVNDLLPKAADTQAEIAQQRLTQLDAEARALEGTASAWERVAGRLGDFRRGLLTDSRFSPLGPLGLLEEARSQFTSAASAALGGDASAAEKLPDLSQRLLDASKAYYASSEGYFRDFTIVSRTLEQTESVAITQLSVARSALAELQGIRAALSGQAQRSAANDNFNGLSAFASLQTGFKQVEGAFLGAGKTLSDLYADPSTSLISGLMTQLYPKITDSGFLSARGVELADAIGDSSLPGRQALARTQGSALLPVLQSIAANGGGTPAVVEAINRMTQALGVVGTAIVTSQNATTAAVETRSMEQVAA